MAICEDELCQMEELRAMCSKILTGMEVEHRISSFASANELSCALKNGERFELLCLDILMEGQTGMELALELRQWDERTSILFVTCSVDHLLDGYSVRPIQYLLKPVRREELERVIQTDLRLRHKPRTIILKTKGKTCILPLAGIRFVESRDHGCMFFMDDGEQMFQISLSEAEALLPGAQFVRCHNSFLVNLEHIRKVSSRETVLQDGSSLPIGRRYGKEFHGRFVRYLNSEES